MVLSDRRARGHQDIVPPQVDVCVHTAPNTLYNVQATQAVLGPCYSEFKVHQQDNISLARLNFSHLVSVSRQSSQRNLQRQRIILSLQMGKLRHSATKQPLHSPAPGLAIYLSASVTASPKTPSVGHGKTPFPPPFHTLSTT